MREAQNPQFESFPKHLPAGSRLIHPSSAIQGSAPDYGNQRWWVNLRVAMRDKFSSRKVVNPQTSGYIQGTGIEADFLRQLRYWQTKQQANGYLMGYERDGLHWIYVTLDELEEQTGFTHQRLLSAIRNLCLLGLLERKKSTKHKFNWTNHYAVHWDRVLAICPLNSASTGLCRSNGGDRDHLNETSITTSTTLDSLQKKELPGTGGAGASSYTHDPSQARVPEISCDSDPGSDFKCPSDEVMKQWMQEAEERRARKRRGH